MGSCARRVARSIVCDDLDGEGLSGLSAPLFVTKRYSVQIGLEARQDVTAVPAQPLSHIIRNLGDEVVDACDFVSGAGCGGADVLWSRQAPGSASAS